MHCSVDGCPKPLRAKGLCSTHYNQAHQPDRHRKVQVACGQCGEPCMKQAGTKYRARFCSYLCRDLWLLDQGELGRTDSLFPGCPVHADLALLRSTQRWKRTLHALLRVARRHAQPDWSERDCAECQVTFTPLSTTQRFCTIRCARRVARRLRRAREYGAPGTYTWPEVMALFLLFDKRCAYCEQRIPGQPDPDHVVPLSRGGSNSITNILPSCGQCNRDKRDLSLDEWNADRIRRGLPPVTTTWAGDDAREQHLTSPDGRAIRTQHAA